MFEVVPVLLPPRRLQRDTPVNMSTPRISLVGPPMLGASAFSWSTLNDPALNAVTSPLISRAGAGCAATSTPSMIATPTHRRRAPLERIPVLLWLNNFMASWAPGPSGSPRQPKGHVEIRRPASDRSPDPLAIAPSASALHEALMK